ncbi:ABC transporter permease [Wenzhouxiangella marina]|uniref:Oxidoreductase n=1 Tax=Wenzhouxiangella marina TaxID=1579979 RepID=A0A0K0XXJ4_9GAMM|nr:FtsX-like permease family protein [Wenzhouxiangella marina]AKS42419.1 oxidoreductase [Wenzhouxiangella marina]MBB6085807.1 putative ABC transport system permease protein [Wenzhouxiangella marina]
MNSFTLSYRLLLRQGRSGSLGLLVAGLLVATAALVAVSVFTDRVGRALDRQAGEALAADLAVASRQPIPEAFREQARGLGLDTAELITLSTAVFVGEESMLIDVKGVSDSYPLRGQLQVADSAAGLGEATDEIPAPGRAWMEPRGLRYLGAEVGDIALVGVHELTIEKSLVYEPDRGGGPFMLAPRLLIHLDDLESSELLGPGTRARYRLLVAGEESALAEYSDWLEDRIDANQRVITAAEADEQTGLALTQARRFLGVAALTTLILAAVGVLLSALRFARAQRDLVALLKSFGATSAQVMMALTLMLLWLVGLAVVLGGATGMAAQAVIAQLLADGPAGALPPPRLTPILGSAAFTLLLAAGFALPPLLNLRQVPPMRILNQSLDQRVGVKGALWLLPIAGALTIPVLQLGNLKLAAIVLGGSLVLTLLLAISGWIGMRLSASLSTRARSAWRFGLAGLRRRRAAGVIQITALGLGLMALLLLMIVRTELLGQWRGSLPEDTPDHFIVNIQPDQVEAVRGRLEAAEAQRLQIRPMANVNLVETSGELNNADRLGRQVNVSWIDELPPANSISEGRFFSADSTGEISLARRWSERTGVKLGDTLTFESGAQRFTATVTSIRDVEWDSFNVNFFILLSPDAGQSLPHQNIASFHLPHPDPELLRSISQQFPNLSILDVGALLDRVGEIIDRVSSAAQVVFFFTLLAGLVVLLAALEATRDERRHESALIRTLGADNALIRRGLLIEYGIMALIAAFLATMGSALTGWLLARELFDFRYAPSLSLFLAGFIAAFVLVVGSGWLGNRSVLATPPVRILRTGKA